MISNLQYEIRGDIVTLAESHGFVSGKGETYRKYLRPCVKSSFSARIHRMFSFESYLLRI